MEIAVAKRKRRQLERQWRHTGLAVHRCLFQEQRDAVASLLRRVNVGYFNQKIKDAQGTGKKQFCVINSLSNKAIAPALPAHESAKALATSFMGYFVDNATKLRKELLEMQAIAGPYSSFQSSGCNCMLATFSPVSVVELH